MGKRLTKKDIEITLYKYQMQGTRTPGIRVQVNVRNKPAAHLFFRPNSGYRSYAYAPIGSYWRFFCGRKKMIRAFLKDFKEKYE